MPIDMQDVGPAGRGVATAWSGSLPSSRATGSRPGPRQHVRRRALQHRDVRRAVPAIAGTSVTAVAPLPITTTLLPGVVEVLGPVLRVDDLAGELVGARELRLVAALVVVVAASSPTAGRAVIVLRLAVVVDLDRPAWRCRVPGGAEHLVAVADQLVDAVLLGDRAEVVEDQRAVGQRGVAGPRPPVEAEREHVGVRADAGVAEQVPGAAAGRRGSRAPPPSCAAGAR